MTNPNDARSQWQGDGGRGLLPEPDPQQRERHDEEFLRTGDGWNDRSAGADEQFSGFQKSGRHRIIQKKKITGGELMAVTIRDVAREAGVSVATVSHALTGYTDISVKTRQKIQETARRLGYQPNVNGRSLASKKSNRIVLIRKK